MSASKKPTSKKTETQEVVESLRYAADILEKNMTSAPKKKPATKAPAKNTDKKPADKKPAEKKPATKKPAEKKPAAKKPKDEPILDAAVQPDELVDTDGFINADAPAEESVAQEQEPIIKAEPDQPAEEPAEKPVAEEPAEEPVAEEPVAEEPVAEEPVAEEPAEQPVEEPAEEPVAEQPAEQPAEEPAKEQPAEQKQKAAKGGFTSKANNFVNNKGKLIIFIVANALLGLSALFMLIGSFDISYLNPLTGKKDSEWYSMFGYFANRKKIVPLFRAMAGSWGDGGYTMLGILMFFAFLVPLALVVKNVILLFRKGDKNVHSLDAMLNYMFLFAYLGVVNMYGANTTWAHVLSLIFAIVLFAFDIFVKLLQRAGRFPIYSIVNLGLVFLCMFLLMATPVYSFTAGSFSLKYYGGAAASLTGGGGFAFIMLLATLAAFEVLMLMQLRKMPKILEIVVPAAMGGCALIALIAFAGAKPDALSMGGGFVFGAILTLLLAAANVVFELVPVLFRHKVKLIDGEASAQKAFCPYCGMEKESEDAFCMNCGKK